MGVGILGQPDCRHHAALTAIASIGKEALRITVRAEAPAVDAPHAYGLQACARDGIEIEQPVPRARRHERLARLADCGSYILAHLVYPRSHRRGGDQGTDARRPVGSDQIEHERRSSSSFLKSRGTGARQVVVSPLAGCISVSSAACSAWRGKAMPWRVPRRYTVSPTSGWRICWKCTRIWCVRPVSRRHSTSVAWPKRSSTR